MAQQIKFGDKLLLKGETLILDNGTSDGVIKSNNGTVKIDGNLTISGTTTTVESETVTISDNQILLNSNFTGPNPTEDAGIEIERGDETNSHFLWQEASSRWTTGAHGLHSGSTISATTFSGNLTGDSAGMHLGGLDTQGATLISSGLSELADVRIWNGTINDTTIGALTPSTGVFTTITATTLIGDLDYSNLINVPTIVDHSIGTLSDVDTTTVAPTTGQTIIWNGTNFVPGESFSQADFNTAFTAKDTDDLSEGTTNLYYTDARVQAVSINNVVEDTTPQLGGNLDLNTYDLSTTDNVATLTTTSSTSSTSSTVVATTETNLSNVTVAFSEDIDLGNAVSSFTTLTSTEIDILGFKGESSLTYFGAASTTSNFVWRDVSDSAEQNDMVVVYAPTPDEYTFTLPHQTLWQIDSTDNDVYFKQYAYGEFSITSATALTTSNTQFRDSNGFYIDPDHVTITNTSGTNYKIVFWTHDVTAGDIIDVFVGPGQQNVVFGWGGITTTGGRLTLLDTSGNLIYKFPTADGSTNQVLETDGSGDLSWSTPTITLSTLKSVVAASSDFADFQSRIAAL